MLRGPKRLLVGRPLRSDRLGETLLSKRLALPIFASDPLSSVAYATQEILLVLSLGGLAYLYLAPWIAVAVVVLLAVVVVSYRQVVRAYPSGGGSYEVATRNLGRSAGLVVAAALLVDYVMTVAVSVAAGVDNIISALPALNPHRVGINIGFVVFLMAMNLRGVRESGRTFAIPTYLFVAGAIVMVAVGLGRAVAGQAPVAESASWQVRPEQVGLTGLAVALLTLRAFASGCTALTGVEAISNGVPAFKPPKSGNAARTLATMGAIAITMFANTALRRTASTVTGEAPVVTTDAFTVDLTNRRVTTPGGQVRLTPTEWHLLEVLARHPGRLVTHQQLLHEVWGPQYTTETNYLRVHIANLRRKLEPDPARPRYVLTDPGIGYRFVASPEQRRRQPSAWGQPPTWMPGRRAGSGSLLRRTSRTTGAVSPRPRSR